MCGIFGLIQKNQSAVSTDTLDSALALLAHRGPDGHGIFQDGPLGLAHTRLAIFDPSENGRQPMAYLHYTIVFNGAIYNFPELRDEIRRHGYTFRTDTDTEVIVAAFDRWATVVAPAAPAPVRCRDPDDQPFIDLAVAHGALLLSKDAQVLGTARRVALLGARVARHWPPA